MLDMETPAGQADSALDDALETDTAEIPIPEGTTTDPAEQDERPQAASYPFDIAERIGRALIQEGEPAPNEGDPVQDDDVIIGTVPHRLRHLFNLISLELAQEVKEAERELNARRARLDNTRNMFFDAIKEHVQMPEDACGLTIRDDWSVVADMEPESDGPMLHMLDLGSLLGVPIGRR